MKRVFLLGLMLLCFSDLNASVIHIDKLQENPLGLYSTTFTYNNGSDNLFKENVLLADKDKFHNNFDISLDDFFSNSDVLIFGLDKTKFSEYKIIRIGSNFQTSNFSPIKSSAAPVPAAVWILGSGILGMIGFRKKIK